MLVPLVVLAVLATVGGFLPIPQIVAPHEHVSHAPVAFQLLATGLALGGLGLAYVLFVLRPELPGVIARRLDGFYDLVRDKFRVDELYDAVVVRPLFAAAEVCARRIDPGVIDGAVNGAGLLVAATSGAWRRVQTGNVQHYALSFLVGVLLLLGYLLGR
jgi:NADH-quinone oxidoreductase subunit L